MTARDRTLILKVVGDVSDAIKDLDKLEDGASKFGTAFRKAAKVATLAAVAAGGAFVVSASKAGAQLDAFENTALTVFGNVGDEAIEASKAAAGIGLSRRQALEQLNYLGNLAQATGATTEEALALSEQTLQLGADFAAFADVPTADTLEAISAATRGEFDALQRYLPTASAATLQEIARAEGLIKEGEALQGAAALQAIYSLALRDGGAAIGAYDRESGSLAATTARLRAKWDNFQATIGKAVLPLLERAVTFFETSLLPAIGAIVEFIRREWPPIYSKYIKPTMVAVQDVVSSVVAFIADIWQRHGERIVGFVQNIIDVVATFGAFVLETFAGVIDFFSNVFAGEWGAAFDSLIEIAQGIIDFFIEMPGKLLALAGDIVGAVIDIGAQIGKGLVNAVISAWNRIDPSISLSVPSWIPGIGGKSWSTGDIVPDLPLLASGGIVNSPTLAMIGEAGPEAVVPLPARFGNTYMIRVEAGISSPADVADSIVEALREYEARNGRAFREAG